MKVGLGSFCRKADVGIGGSGGVQIPTKMNQPRIWENCGTTLDNHRVLHIVGKLVEMSHFEGRQNLTSSRFSALQVYETPAQQE